METGTADGAREAGLWQRLRERGDDDARDALLAMHMPYARVIAASLYAKRFHDEVEFGDYLQLASVGMLEALTRFDPSRGVQFRSFAARRMQGAILNGLERLTEKQQQIAARQRLRAARLEDVRSAAAQDAADPLRDPQQLARYVAQVGIGLALCWILEGSGMVEDADAATALPFYRGTALSQLRQRLLRAVDALPAAERQVLRSHYLQEVPFETIAGMMCLTKGRISQIHKQALQRLRTALREDADWDLEL